MNAPMLSPRPGLTIPVWHQASDDALFGVQAMADYLALPFLDVRTMIGMGRLPTWKECRSHACRRTSLAAHFAALERKDVAVGSAAPLPADIGPDGSLGLLSGQAAIAGHLNCTVSAVRNDRARSGLPVFWVGKTPFARRASLDLWSASGDRETRLKGKRIERLDRLRAALPEAAIIGAAAIADRVGCTPRAAFIAIHRGHLLVHREGRAVWAYPGMVDRYADRRNAHTVKNRETQHGVG